jgi:hypothetical protein
VTAPDKVSQIVFTVTAGVAGPVVITGAVPPGLYTINIGMRSGSNSEYLAITTPVGVAENSNFSPFGKGF